MDLRRVTRVTISGDGSPMSDEPEYRDLSDWVVLRVLSAIRRGEFHPGERLLEEDLAQRFGVSRAPVRDAIAKLTALGIVGRRRPRGVFVRPWTEHDRAEVHELVDALIFLSVDLTVGRLSAQDIEALEAVVDGVREDARQENSDPLRELERDAEFHMIMARASGNERLVQLLEELTLPARLYAQESAEYLEPEFWLHIHGELLDAVKSGDRDAALAIAIRNMRESRQKLLERRSAPHDS